MTYCTYVRTISAADPLHVHYHDHHYGFPLQEDAALFERLVLEINQAGLSWLTILKKQENFRQAYDGFNLDRVAAYNDHDRERLLANPGIIRNRLKVNAAIENARRIVRMREEFGSFAGWLDHHHPLSREEWTRLFKQTFLFTGGEIVNEFLMSTGYLPGTHDPDCPTYSTIQQLQPAWMRGSEKSWK